MCAVSESNLQSRTRIKQAIGTQQGLSFRAEPSAPPSMAGWRRHRSRNNSKSTSTRSCDQDNFTEWNWRRHAGPVTIDS
jgi:hypothetical protein